MFKLSSDHQRKVVSYSTYSFLITHIGIIKVKGVRWKIDCIEGKHDFKFKKPYTSQIRVLPSLGKVIFAIDGLKNQLCYGEINKCRLNIANTSRVAIDKVFLINSYPEMFGFESKELGSLQAGSTIEVNA